MRSGVSDPRSCRVTVVSIVSIKLSLPYKIYRSPRTIPTTTPAPHKTPPRGRRERPYPVRSRLVEADGESAGSPPVYSILTSVYFTHSAVFVKSARRLHSPARGECRATKMARRPNRSFPASPHGGHRAYNGRRGVRAPAPRRLLLRRRILPCNVAEPMLAMAP